MFYSLSEILTLCKQNMGMRDLPKPVTDQDLRWRLEHSTLKEFSQVCPYTAQFIIGETERLCHPYSGVPSYHTDAYSLVYRIPRSFYQERTIIAVSDVQPARPHGYNDLYVPGGAVGSPIGIITAAASVQMAAAMATMVGHSITWDFRAPDICILYNAWSGGHFEIELQMTHDPSLSTIPPSAFSKFIQICELDLQEYIYKKLQRVQNLELGTGNIELKIDEWSDAGNRKRELLDDLADASAMDTMHIQRW